MQANQAELYGKAAPQLPPGADASENSRQQQPFGERFEPPFSVPRRLADKSTELVEAVNDFHFAMVNDLERNEFYRDALKQVITPESRVLEVGAGSGLLSMLCAQLGAKWVVACEANVHMAGLARSIVKKNNFQDRITILHKLSTELEPADLPEGERPNVFVSELFGTLLLGESCLDYIQDCRDRLLEPGASIVPALGVQYAQLIECWDVHSLTAVKEWQGLDLSNLNLLQDTASTVFTKQYGFRLCTVPHKKLSPRLAIVKLDFHKDRSEDLPQERHITFQALGTGVVHAVLFTWDALSADKTLVMTTEPGKTSFQRDMQWGQAIQLVEDMSGYDGDIPVPLHVTEGEVLTLIVKLSEDGCAVQCDVLRGPAPSGPRCPVR
eukprot:TRINITY_DN2506_c0_g1_i1.p1 TRINITY_DN2506_c0_g1~~TRINITY_DN2506_c0_g1_i1.p1  ORF type:complete len:394 (+),score=81.19 TRINITY_DN2506_c0_g1_i1:37-1182(+)